MKNKMSEHKKKIDAITGRITCTFGNDEAVRGKRKGERKIEKKQLRRELLRKNFFFSLIFFFAFVARRPHK